MTKNTLKLVALSLLLAGMATSCQKDSEMVPKKNTININKYIQR